MTGGSGFIGSNFVPEISKIADVRNLDMEPPRDRAGLPHWQEGSVLDLEFLRRQFAEFRPTHVLHLAARTDLTGGSIGDYPANTTGVENVIRAIKETPSVVHTVYTSSRLVFAIDHVPTHDYDYQPSTAYGESKVAGEEIVRRTASDASSWTIVRPTSIWGPWFDVPYRDFFDMVARGRYVSIRGKDPLKSFGYVGNAVYELVQILRTDPTRIDGQVLWLSDYEPIRLSDWANMVASALGRPAPRIAPWSLVRAAAAAGDVLSLLGANRVPLTSFRLKNLVADMVYDARPTEEVVGDVPYSLREGVETTVEWYRLHDAKGR